MLEHEEGAGAGCAAALRLAALPHETRVLPPNSGGVALSQDGHRVALGAAAALRWAARAGAPQLLGSGTEAARVEERCALLEQECSVAALERALLLRTFLLGHQLSLADLLALELLPAAALAAAPPAVRRWRALVLARCGLAPLESAAAAGGASVNLGSQGSFAKARSQLTFFSPDKTH